MEKQTKTICGDYCRKCHKVWVQYPKIVHFMDLNKNILQDLPPLTCCDCKRKRREKVELSNEMKLNIEWLGFKFKSLYIN